MADGATVEPQASPLFLQQLRGAEEHWVWKFGLRVALCVLNIIGIGCAAWLALTASVSSYFGDYIGYFDFIAIPGSLAAMTVSFLWCLIVILVNLLRRPPRQPHPGIAVGIDLILWLGLIVTALFTIGSVITTASFGSNPNYLSAGTYNGHYDGKYSLASNGTWVYHITYVDNSCYDYSSRGCHYNYTTGVYTTNRTAATIHRRCEPYFDTCVEQDAYINMLWQTKPKREGLEIAVAAVQWLGVLFHFILFVWACVDTNRRNRSHKTRDEAVIAERIIRDMQARGLITVHNSAVVGTQRREMEQPGRAPTDPDEIGQAR